MIRIRIIGLPEVNGDHDVDDGNTLTVIVNGDDGDASKRAGDDREWQ